MSRPGWLVAAEQEARNEAERNGWHLDYLPDRDEQPTPAPAVEDDLMARIREGAALMHEQQRREAQWREATKGRL